MWKKILKTVLVVLVSVALLGLLSFAFRRPLMRAAGSWLIVEDAPETCDALFILSGGALDRSKEAYRLVRSGYAPFVVCTGENVPSLLELLDLNITESELTRKALNRLGLADSLIRIMHNGSSTREEADLILNYAISGRFKTVMVLSDKFHTRRVQNVFRKRFEDAGIKLLVIGAPSTRYHEMNWWANEAGLLMVNNEYIKLIYYFLSGLSR